jgi:hypothetical protein
MSRLSVALTVAVLFGALVVLVAFAFRALLLSGPGNEDRAEATQEMAKATEFTEETTAYGEERTVIQGGVQGEDVLEAPPDSTLSYGKREARRSPSPSSESCWVTRNTGGCLTDQGDAGPTRPPKKKLYVPSGSEMVFHYEAPRPPQEVTAYIVPLLGQRPDGSARLGTHAYDSESHGSGVERTIPAKWPPGEYLVFVTVVDPQGVVSYTFRVVVQ